MDPKIVYVVQHVHEVNPGDEDVKMIGVYSTEDNAKAAVDRLRRQPGFCDAPDGFYIDSYSLNIDHWTDGYFTYEPPEQ